APLRRDRGAGTVSGTLDNMGCFHRRATGTYSCPVPDSATGRRDPVLRSENHVSPPLQAPGERGTRAAPQARARRLRSSTGRTTGVAVTRAVPEGGSGSAGARDRR